ncbi:MAG: DNA polymerase III subunit alpha [Myxococcales bacterium]|nr:DNA polymerase III subunit alpha [Myxococcales bacterium]
MSDFVHLHVHSQYSMLDSSLRLKAMVQRAAELKMPALALTDHGNMFGAVQFHRACGDAGIKPILGCEVNLCRDHRDQQSRDSRHLVLLAGSQQGYRNLVRLVSLGWVEGLQHGKPRVDFEQLREHHNGLVGLSACMGGHLAQEVLLHGEAVGQKALGELAECFEPGAFYVELQDHGFIEQRPLNRILVQLARDQGLPLVASNDCHYLEREHARAQMVLQCISAGANVEDMERSHHGSEQLFFKSAEQMRELFGELPEALANTLEIAERCGGVANPLQKPMLPNFQLPEGRDEETHFRSVARNGLDKRFGEFRLLGKDYDEKTYRQRLEMECDVIISMGFPGYFLIVHDFIHWSKEHSIPVGPGRGSGAGSLVAYSLGITDIDPLPYGLLFERFLNPERVSMPDFDIDFCMDRRDEVIDYVRRKYGTTSVGQIATFHLLKSRSVVRDVGRVMGMTPQDAGRIATMIPDPIQGKTVSIAEAIDQEKRLAAAYEEEGRVKELLDTAMSLEDLNRHAGMHAAGVVISDGPLWDHVPVFCPEPGAYVTQYHKDDVEAAGLVKFDFLGLKTLTVVKIAVDLINKRPDRQGDPFHIDRISLEDAATFALLQSGETTNVFQLESSGMQTLIKKLRPDCFEDVVALVALYRPGPLGSGMVDDYVDGKHGRKKVEYPHACLEGILRETFGVMVYQEQVMQAAQVMAGYSLGGADLLRRAMGKKKPAEMAKQEVLFVEGALENGHSKEDAKRVFDLMSYFSGYGFNKSHSAAYALIAYQCAYLKAHYPVEFLCATMTADKDKTEKVVRTVSEARAMGVTVLPPDVNESEIDFSVVYSAEAAEQAKAQTGQPRPERKQPAARKGKVYDPMQPRIRFGLGAVKGIGSSALESIFDTRVGDKDSRGVAAAEPFIDLFDFTGRVDLRRVNKGVVEALIQCGAMDSLHDPLGIHRARALTAADIAIERGKKASADRESGQTDLFGMLGGDDAPSQQAGPRAFPEVPAWQRKELLKREKATLGFYISGHPLDGYRQELARFCNATTATLSTAEEGSEVAIGGMIEELRIRKMKSGGKLAFFQLEDPLGRTEIMVREKVLDQYIEVLQGDDPVLVRGVARAERGRDGDGPGPEKGAGMRLVLSEVAPLAEAIRARTKAIRLRMHVDRIDRRKLQDLRQTLEDFPGACPVTFELRSDEEWNVTLGTPKLLVDPSEDFMSRLERLFGEKVCELR